MATLKRIIHFKLQSIGFFEVFLQVLFKGNPSLYQEFWFLKEAENSRPSPIPVRSFSNLLRLWFCEDVKKFDLIHVHFGTNALLVIPLVLRSRLPLVVSFYGYDVNAFPSKWFGLGGSLLKLVFRSATKLIAMSQPMAERLVELGAEKSKIEILLPGIQNLAFTKEPVKKIERLLMVSALKEKKNHLLVLEAMKLLLGRGIDIRLSIVGHGPLLESLKSIASDFGLDEQVNFEGSYREINELAQYLKNSDLLLHPSKRACNGDGEGVPASILEGLSVGMPIISSKHNQMDRVFKNSVLYVDENSPEELAQLLQNICNDPESLHEWQKNALQWSDQNLNTSILERDRLEIYRSAYEESQRNIL